MRSVSDKLHRFWHLARAAEGFLRARERLGYPPTHLWIEPTNGCNLKCIHCPTGIGLERERGSIDFALVEKLIAEAQSFQPLVYFHLGGESLLHPRLPEMIRLAGASGLPTAMFTNGTLLDRRRGELLLESGLQWLGISFDGLDAATYERIRRGASFERVLGNVVDFLALRRARGSRTPYTYMSVVDLSADAGEERRSAWDATRVRLRAAGLDHLELAAPHTWAGLALDAPDAATPRLPTRCPAPWSGLAILWNGTAVPCCIDIEGRLPVGDLNHSTIEEVWNGPALAELRRAFLTGRWEALPQVCRECHVPREPTWAGIPVKAWIELKEELLGVG